MHSLFKLILTTIVSMSALVSAYGEAPKYEWKLVTEVSHGRDKVYMAGFMNSEYGIMVGYGGTVYYTQDAGKNWSVGMNSSMCRWGLDILNEKTAFSCGNAGNNRVTTDGGATWTAISDFGGMEPENGKFISFTDRENGWVATSRLLASTGDGGKNWKQLNTPKGSKAIYALQLRTPTEGYVLDKTGQLFHTGDGGSSWQKMTLDLKERKIIGYAFNNPVAAVHFSDALNGKVLMYFVSPERQWVSFSTADGGKSWAEEELATAFGTAYLSHDGQYLTIHDSIEKTLHLYQYR